MKGPNGHEVFDIDTTVCVHVMSIQSCQLKAAEQQNAALQKDLIELRKTVATPRGEVEAASQTPKPTEDKQVSVTTTHLLDSGRRSGC
jgi:hypothetical protein